MLLAVPVKAVRGPVCYQMFPVIYSMPIPSGKRMFNVQVICKPACNVPCFFVRNILHKTNYVKMSASGYMQIIVFSELSEMRTVMCFGIDFSPHICIVEELVMTLLIIVKFGKWEKPDGVRFADPLHNKGVSNESCGVCAENVYGRV